VDKETINKSMRRLQNGDIAALDDIYHNLSKLIYLLCYSILRNPESAKDIMQETFIRVVANIEQYKHDTNATAWIAKIARNLSLRQYTNSKRNIYLDTFKDESDNFSDEQWTDSLLLKKALKILDKDEREIVMLHAVQDFKHREIAEIVDKPIGTVQWIYNKAIKKLKDYMKTENRVEKFVYTTTDEFETRRF